MPREPRRTDADKIGTGTFDNRFSEAAFDQRYATKILSFPQLKRIPEPTLPLGEVGRAKFDELCRTLLDSQRLTAMTVTAVEHIAAQHESAHMQLKAGKPVSASCMTQIRNALMDLGMNRIKAPTEVAAPKEQNSFRFAGFSARGGAKIVGQ